MKKSGKSSIFKNIWLIMLSVGPGIFCIGYTIGTGSVTSMAKAGSEFGMQLLWVLFLSVLFSWVFVVRPLLMKGKGWGKENGNKYSGLVTEYGSVQCFNNCLLYFVHWNNSIKAVFLIYDYRKS